VRIKRNDMVVLTKAITGAAHADNRPMGKESKGSVARVLKVMPRDNQAVVEGVKLAWKHLRRSQQNPQGSRVAKEAAVSLSNLMLFCAKCNGPARVRRQVITKEDASGKSRRQVVRICKRCGEAIGAA
jgi:large subunit ribosomal protein L24